MSHSFFPSVKHKRKKKMSENASYATKKIQQTTSSPQVHQCCNFTNLHLSLHDSIIHASPAETDTQWLKWVCLDFNLTFFSKQTVGLLVQPQTASCFSRPKNNPFDNRPFSRYQGNGWDAKKSSVVTTQTYVPNKRRHRLLQEEKPDFTK